jgi:DNA primase
MAGVSPEVVTAEVERRRKLLIRSAQRTDEREQTRPGIQMQPPEKALRYDDPGSAAAEEGLIRLLYNEPALVKRPNLPPAEDFSAPALGRIYGVIRQKLERGDTVNTATLGAELSGEEMNLLVRVIQKPEVLNRSDQALQDYIRKIQEHKDARQPGTDLRDLQKKLKETKGYRG